MRIGVGSRSNQPNYNFYASVKNFALLNTSYVLEVNNTKGTETVVSHAFTSGGLLSHDVLAPVTTNQGYKTDLVLEATREN